MRTAVCMLLAVSLASAAAHADKAKPVDCSKAAKRRARAAADKAMKSRDYKKAIAALEPFGSGCSESGDAVEDAWLASDLAVAYQRNGQVLECRRLMEGLTYPKSDVARSGNEKVMKALEFNLEQCAKAFDAQYATIKSDKCPLTIDDAAASAALPPALAPSDATVACVALVPGAPAARAAKADDEDVGDVVCPRVALVARRKGGKVTRQLLGAADTPLVDETFCCGLDTIAVGVKDGKALIRVGADSYVRECHGGTASTTLDAIFEWKGSALSGVVDASTLVW